jgi:hypothetical protein
MPLAIEDSLKVPLASYERRECIRTYAMEKEEVMHTQSRRTLLPERVKPVPYTKWFEFKGLIERLSMSHLFSLPSLYTSSLSQFLPYHTSSSPNERNITYVIESADPMCIRVLAGGTAPDHGLIVRSKEGIVICVLPVDIAVGRTP